MDCGEQGGAVILFVNRIIKWAVQKQPFLCIQKLVLIYYSLKKAVLIWFSF